MEWVNDLWTILGLGSIGEMCKILVWWGFESCSTNVMLWAFDVEVVVDIECHI